MLHALVALITAIEKALLWVNEPDTSNQIKNRDIISSKIVVSYRFNTV